MAAWKMLTIAFKAKRGWDRIPPERRQKMLDQAGQAVSKHGPTVARGVGKGVEAVARRTRKAG